MPNWSVSPIGQVQSIVDAFVFNVRSKPTALKDNVENALDKKNVSAARRLEMELWHDLAQFMNTDVVYTLKRLLPADLKTMYVRTDGDPITVDPNPFAVDFAVSANETNGGVWLTEHICYGCVHETDWSVQLADEICSMDWECSVCKQTFNVTGMQKLQHKAVCVRAPVGPTAEELSREAQLARPSNAKEFKCTHCKQTLYLTSVDVLRHRKTCK